MMMNLFDQYPDGENEGFDPANEDPADRTDRIPVIKEMSLGSSIDETIATIAK